MLSEGEQAMAFLFNASFGETRTGRAEEVVAHPERSRLVAAWILLNMIAVIGVPAHAQNDGQQGSYQVGTVLTAPAEVGAAAAEVEAVRGGPAGRSLACDMICSPFDPRQTIAQLSWPDRGGGVAPQDAEQPVDTSTLRLEIVRGSGRFEDGDFGTVRLSAVPVIEAQPGIGIDIQAAKSAAQPAPFQPVEDNRVMARDPDLPATVDLMLERVPGTLERFSQPAREALQRDAQTGGIGRMHVVGQTVELQQEVPRRTVVVEGMQPGLTYKVRLVQESPSAASKLAQNICRVPVCPADFVGQ